jgi:hypothetical protein
MNERESLMIACKGLGYDASQLERLPNYAIETLVEEKKAMKRKSNKKSVGLNSKTLRYMERDCGVVEDDNVTVVNMQSFTNTTSPSDQKHKRFLETVGIRNELMRAIKTNSQVLESRREHLEDDDIFVFESEIKHIQTMLAETLSEIKQITTWFKQIHNETLSLYEQLPKDVVDITGKFRLHFEKKKKDIDNYLLNIEKEGSMVITT